MKPPKDSPNAPHTTAAAPAATAAEAASPAASPRYVRAHEPAAWKRAAALTVLRWCGWRVRGMMPVPMWRSTVVVWAPRAWQRWALTHAFSTKLSWLPTDLLEAEDHDGLVAHCLHAFRHGQTNAVATNASPEHLAFLAQVAADAKSKICLCAFEGKRRFVHIHAPFRTSMFPDRDVHYMRRYFKYFVRRGATPAR